jgi:hypothetical protein
MSYAESQADVAKQEQQAWADAIFENDALKVGSGCPLVLKCGHCPMNTAIMVLKVGGFRAAFGSKGYKSREGTVFWEFGGVGHYTFQQFINPLLKLLDGHLWAVEKTPLNDADPLIADCVFDYDLFCANLNGCNVSFGAEYYGKCLVLPRSVWEKYGFFFKEAPKEVCEEGLALLFDGVYKAVADRVAADKESLVDIHLVKVKCAIPHSLTSGEVEQKMPQDQQSDTKE